MGSIDDPLGGVDEPSRTTFRIVGDSHVEFTMRVAPDSIEVELLRLPTRDRARIAALLLASLDETADANVDEAWAAEAERRSAELREGAAAAAPAADMQARMEGRLHSADEPTG